MGHRNNPANLARRDDEPRSGPHDHRRPPDRQNMPRPRPPGHEEEFRDDPAYMAGNNTYREPGRFAHEGPGYYGGDGRDADRYQGAGYWDSEEDRAQRGEWHSDDYRRPPPRAAQPYPPSPYRQPDYRGGERPAGGYGSYGSTDGAYGDVQRHNPQQGQQHGHFDPDYHQWRTEQMNKLDEDYRSWRSDRYKKFSDEFKSWRSARQTEADGTGNPDGVNHDIEGTAKPNTGTGTVTGTGSGSNKPK